MQQKNSKILFLLHLPPPVHGSSMVGQYIKDSAIINQTFECRYINLLASKKLNNTGNVSFFKLFCFIQVWVRLLKKCIVFKPDVCYFALTSTGFAFYRDVCLVFLLKLFGVKTVYHLHNKGIANNSKRTINKILYKFVFKNSAVILLSESLYYDIKGFVPQTNVFVCPNGIPAIKQNVEERNNCPIEILFLSNLIESKGVFILLKACKILQEKGLNFHCTCIGGEGDISKHYFSQKVDELMVSDHVSYLGKRLGKEKDEAFRKADIFAFPTFYHYECFPLVLLEAMQYSLPIVSTFEGGILDMVIDSETGFLVEQKNIEILANRLEILIKNPGMRKKMGEAGCQLFHKKYTLDIFEQNMKTILVQILNR